MLKILQELTSRYKLPDEVYDFLILLYSIRLSELCVEEEHVFLQKLISAAFGERLLMQRTI